MAIEKRDDFEQAKIFDVSPVEKMNDYVLKMQEIESLKVERQGYVDLSNKLKNEIKEKESKAKNLLYDIGAANKATLIPYERQVTERDSIREDVELPDDDELAEIEKEFAEPEALEENAAETQGEQPGQPEPENAPENDEKEDTQDRDDFDLPEGFEEERQQQIAEADAQYIEDSQE